MSSLRLVQRGTLGLPSTITVLHAVNAVQLFISCKSESPKDGRQREDLGISDESCRKNNLPLQISTGEGFRKAVVYNPGSCSINFLLPKTRVQRELQRARDLIIMYHVLFFYPRSPPSGRPARNPCKWVPSSLSSRKITCVRHEFESGPA